MKALTSVEANNMAAGVGEGSIGFSTCDECDGKPDCQKASRFGCTTVITGTRRL